MTLRERVEEFKLVLRAEIVQQLLNKNHQPFHDLCITLMNINPMTQAYNYWVLFEMSDEGVITIDEDQIVELHTIY